MHARNLISKNYYSKAKKVLEALISEGVIHSDVFYLLGETYRLLENFKKSEEYLHRSISMKICSPFAYLSLGKLYQTKQEYKESIDYLQEFLKRLDDAEGHYELGRSFAGIGYYEEAIEEYSLYIDMKRFLNLDPAVLILRAEAYEAVEMFDFSNRDYELVLKINPNFYAPYLEYAEELANSGMYDESRSITDFVRSKTHNV